MKKILILAPHADDGEFGCGASIKRFSEEGAEIFYAAFSPCQISMPKGSKELQLYDELERAVSHLGIKKENIYKFDFQVRVFTEYRQQILDKLIDLRKEINPDLVLLPNSDDIHQDHQVIHTEGRRAFKNVSMLGYELPWNNRHFLSNYYIKITDSHLNAKANAIAEYKSQTFRPYMDIDFFKGLARVRGIQANADYAEAFELIKWVH
ncbi:MAG: PIG-L family deacetylase [Balneolaceae bacterium]|nr:PIG-L family deacetylase [Balneolaceae bacterium]